MGVNMKMGGAFCLSLSFRVQLETALCFSSGLKLAFPAEAPLHGRLPAADTHRRAFLRLRFNMSIQLRCTKSLK